jgi:nitrate/nitrite transporter NarK
LIVTQFQGAYSDNILRNLLLAMIVGMGLAGDERSSFVSLVTFLFSMPFVLFSMTGGWLADRFSKRRVTLWTKGMEIGAMTVATVGLAAHSQVTCAGCARAGRDSGRALRTFEVWLAAGVAALQSGCPGATALSS